MALYNISNFSSSLNYLDQAVALNQLSGGAFGFFMLFTVPMLLLFGLLIRVREPLFAIVAVTMWVTVIWSGMLLGMGLIPLSMFYVTLVISFGSAGAAFMLDR